MARRRAVPHGKRPARLAPPIPTASAFPELNVRTYVRYRERTGVWFFSLDATSRLAVWGARRLFNLPYFDADITVASRGESVDYRSRRVHRDAPAAALQATYRATGPSVRATPGTLEHFLVERYCLFAQSQTGNVGYLDVDHAPWPLQPATAAIEVNTMTAGVGIALPNAPPVTHFARSLDVVAWKLVSISGSADSRRKLVLARDAVQARRRAQDQAAARDRGRRHAHLAERVLAQQLVLRARLKTYVSPSSLSAKIFPLAAHGDDVNATMPSGAMRWRGRSPCPCARRAQ